MVDKETRDRINYMHNNDAEIKIHNGAFPMFMENSHYLLLKKKSMFESRGTKRGLLSAGSRPKCPQQAGLGQAEAGHQDLWPSLTRGWQGPKPLGLTLVAGT